MDTNEKYQRMEDIRVMANALGRAIALMETDDNAGYEAARCFRLGASGTNVEDQTDALMAAMWAIAELSDGLAAIQSQAVATARLKRMSWNHIGMALGISRQAAQQRYGS